MLDLGGGGGDIMHVELATPPEINHVSEDWEKVSCTADSGAVDIVGPPSAAACIPTKESKA